MLLLLLSLTTTGQSRLDRKAHSRWRAKKFCVWCARKPMRSFHLSPSFECNRVFVSLCCVMQSAVARCLIAWISPESVHEPKTHPLQVNSKRCLLLRLKKNCIESVAGSVTDRRAFSISVHRHLSCCQESNEVCECLIRSATRKKCKQTCLGHWFECGPTIPLQA